MLEKNSLKVCTFSVKKKKFKRKKEKGNVSWGEKKKREELTVIDSSICVWRTPKAELHGKLIQA